MSPPQVSNRGIHLQVIYARQPIDNQLASKGSVFLAGPTPRSEFPYPSWRPEALQLLEKFDYDGVVFVPEDEDGGCHGDYTHQVEWEEEALTVATCILFWFARIFPEMPALTTNDEWGAWKKSGKVVFGAPPWAAKVNYQKYYAKKYGVPMSDTLEKTVISAIFMEARIRIMELGGPRYEFLFPSR